MKLRNVSASQVESWNACPRKWHFEKVRGFKEPPTAAQQRGTAIHAVAEYAVNHAGAMPDSPYVPFGQAMLPYLPIGQPRVLAEYKMNLATAPGLPPWFGVIDLVDDSRSMSKYLRITDHKTSSDFRYAKTPEELRENTQVACYAKWVYETGHDEEFVEVGHLYIHTKGDTIPKRKPPRILPVYTLVDQPQVERVWARDLLSVEAMVQATSIANTDLLEPRGTSNGTCTKYGGCPHRQRCGIRENAPSNRKLTKDQPATMSAFLAKITAAKAANPALAAAAAAANASKPAEAASAPATAPKAPPAAAAAPAAGAVAGPAKGIAAALAAKAQAARAAAPTGIMPPDAASRVTPVKAKGTVAPPPPADEGGEEGDDVDHAVPTGAAEGGDPEPVTAPAPEKRPVGRPKKGSTVSVAPGTLSAFATRSGFALYVDCMPVKDTSGTGSMMFEDWVAPIIASLNEEVQTTKSLADYRMLPFSEEKTLFALAINAAISSMPPALVVNSSASRARDALDVLIPHASLVVRGLRG